MVGNGFIGQRPPIRLDLVRGAAGPLAENRDLPVGDRATAADNDKRGAARPLGGRGLPLIEGEACREGTDKPCAAAEKRPRQRLGRRYKKLEVVVSYSIDYQEP